MKKCFQASLPTKLLTQAPITILRAAMTYTESIVEVQRKLDMAVSKPGSTQKKNSTPEDRILSKMEEKHKAEQVFNYGT